MGQKVEVKGFCDDRFASVKEAFTKNFEDGLEVGASFAATLNGKFIVDLWAGYSDEAKTKPWMKDTIVNVYSTTKVITAICALILVDRKQLDLDAPVAKYWPEFAQQGKENIPVRYLFSHSSGLAGFTEPISLDEFYNWEIAINRLASQKPWWEPGTKSGYHGLTFGHLLGELIRRITGKTIGAFLREKVAGPLGAEFYIGVPEEHEKNVAELIPAPLLEPDDPLYISPDSLLIKSLSNPAITVDHTKTRAWRAAELPSVNGHGNARSVARIASIIACGGEVDSIHFLSMQTIEKALEEQIKGIDYILEAPVRLGLGLGLNSEEMPISPNPRTLSWGGAGGSVAIMDVDAKLSISYVMNKMGNAIMGDPRPSKLISSLYSAL